MKNNTLTTKLFLAIAIIFAVVMRASADTYRILASDASNVTYKAGESWTSCKTATGNFTGDYAIYESSSNDVVTFTFNNVSNGTYNLKVNVMNKTTDKPILCTIGDDQTSGNKFSTTTDLTTMDFGSYNLSGNVTVKITVPWWAEIYIDYVELVSTDSGDDSGDSGSSEDDTEAVLKVEAENGTSTTGWTQVSSDAYSNGYAMEMTDHAETQQLTLAFNVATAGDYYLKVMTRGYGNQMIKCSVNSDTGVETYAVPDELGLVTLGKYALTKGSNTVDINAEWGYVDIDYAEFVPASEIGTPTASSSTTIEAEQGVMINCSKVKSFDSYSFSNSYAVGMIANTSSLSMAFNVANEGSYKLIVCTTGNTNDNNNSSQFYCSVNNGSNTTITAPSTDLTEIEVGTYTLSAGETTVKFTTNWTWFYIDYVKLVSTSEESGDEESTTKYTATFNNIDGNDGTTTKQFAEGETIEPPVATKDGYYFAGWSPVLDVMPAEDATYTAQFTQITASAAERTATARLSKMDLTAAEVAHYMAPAWNLGNTLEGGNGNSACYSNSSTGTETQWQNTKTTQAIIDYVKSQGFKSVRIPCAWVMGHISDKTNMTIDADWMTRVKEVIDYCINDGLYVVINDHWDGGWLEYDGFTTSAEVETLNTQFSKLWTNIATALKDYDEHVIFAGLNEPGVGGAGPIGGTLMFSQYGTNDAATLNAFVTRLQTYEQTFIDAVRATGGNNAKRVLVVQGPKTDLNWTANYYDVTKLNDTATDRLMVEVHFYEPYQFCSMSSDADWGNMQYYWVGSGYDVESSTHKGTYTDKSIVDELALMKTKFVDNGYPVIIGEYGADWRQISGDGESQSSHNQSLQYWYTLVTRYAMENGIIPFQWDINDYSSNKNSCINRSDCSVLNSYVMNGIAAGASAGKSTFEDIYPLPDVVLTVTDDDPTIPAYTYAAGELAYSRTIKEGYATFVVPFDVDLTPYKDVAFTKAWTFDADATYIDETKNLIKIATNEVSLTSTIPAGTLFITKCKDLSLTLKNSKETTLTGDEAPTNQGIAAITDLEISVLGTYQKVTGLNKTYYRAFHASNGNFGPTTWVNPFRVYVYKYGSESALAKYSLGADFSGDGDATIIDGAENVISDVNAPAYNMIGQRVKADAKGIVIINGKKTFNK